MIQLHTKVKVEAIDKVRPAFEGIIISVPFESGIGHYVVQVTKCKQDKSLENYHVNCEPSIVSVAQEE